MTHVARRLCGTVCAGLRMALALATVLSFVAARADAQAAPGTALRPEIRLDYLGGGAHAVHVGAGVSLRAGTYVRVGANAGVAPYAPRGGSRAHGDLTARFLLDPFGQAKAGVSLGGGIGLRLQDGRARAFALMYVDVEAGPGGRWAPFGRAGFGGGPRLAIGLRRGASRGR